MILDRTPLTLSEVETTIKDIEDSEKKQEMELYLKKFLKLKTDKATKMKEEIEKLDLLKLKREHIVKIVDLVPEDFSDLNKIFVDISLNEEEMTKILGIVKANK